MFEILKNETDQKVGRMQGDVNILKEGLRLTESTASSNYKEIKEEITTKFVAFDKHVIEGREKDKIKTKRIMKLEDQVKDLSMKLNELKEKYVNTDHSDTFNPVVENKQQSPKVNKAVENFIITQIENSNNTILDKLDEIK